MTKPSCPDCELPMKIKTGPRGKFWSCQSYPACKGTRDYDATLGKPAQQQMVEQLQTASEFVLKMGSLKAAKDAIAAVELLMGQREE